jgi:acetyltransferase-like isoleucine patch superfamily enzyme
MKGFQNVEELILGKNVKLEGNVSLKGKKMVFGDETIVRSGTKINVSEYFEIGKKSIVGENNTMRGRDIRLGREFYSNHDAEIGGGGCFENTSKLSIGYWFHLGSYAMVNTAMEVKIGNEVGFGRFTNVYTHGAYQSVLKGFPVDFGPINIGNNVWVPGATVLPHVTIGDNSVIAAGSLVLNDIPSNCLAAGIPCKVIKSNHYPRNLSQGEKVRIIKEINNRWQLKLSHKGGCLFQVAEASVDFERMLFTGKASEISERARNILRRNGIRFKVDIEGGHYATWNT